MTKKERYKWIIDWFENNMPLAQTELNYDSYFHLLIAVILSAQCTDKRVNMVTPSLFKAFPTAESLAGATNDQIYAYIKSISYPNSKAKNLISMAQKLVSEYGGEVPETLKELESLPGVGRKTANVMLSVAFDKPAMAVDTHVFRLSNRIGLTNNSKTPLETEKELVKNIPRNLLSKAHHWLILHGRYICIARNPKCYACGISSHCKYYLKNTKVQDQRRNS